MAISFSIKPLLRTDKPVKENGTLPINFLIRIGNKQVKIPTKKEIEEKFWDKKAGKAKKTHPNSSMLNSSLAKAEQEFRDFVLKHELSGKQIGLQEVKKHFKGVDYFLFYFSKINNCPCSLEQFRPSEQGVIFFKSSLQGNENFIFSIV